MMHEPQKVKKLERRYSLEELSVRWDKPISTLKEWVRTVQFKQVGAILKINGRVEMTSLHFQDAKGVWKNRGTHATDKGPYDIVVDIDPHELFDGLTFADNEEPFIPETEVLRFEQERNLGSEQETIPPSLPNLNWIKAPHLKIAIKAYYHFHVLENMQPNRAPIPQITEWLGKRFPNLTTNAKNKIATIVNTRKEGGAPPAK